MQGTQRPAGLKKLGPDTLSQFTQWGPLPPRSGGSDTLKIVRWNEMCMHGEGLRRCHLQLFDLLAHIARDELDGRLHFWHHTLRFRDPLQARRAELFLLGHGADRGDVLLDITGDELAVATHAALQVHKVVGVANGPNALADLLPQLCQALVLLASGFHLLHGLLRAWCHFWGTARAAVFQGRVEALGLRLYLFERLFSRGEGLGGGTLFGGHG